MVAFCFEGLTTAPVQKQFMAADSAMKLCTSRREELGDFEILFGDRFVVSLSEKRESRNLMPDATELEPSKGHPVFFVPYLQMLVQTS